MTSENVDIDEERQRKSKAVARAVARLSDNLGYEPEIVFEGAVRGACAVLISHGVTPADVSRLLTNSGRLIETLDQDNES
ncbi:hypothetical protein RsS62_23990 [Rhizobium dioscoreae]|uniref:hypothetical protein n=1 Tax=Rhizobium dioscoreae TaxID=2653122 RepID=UPI0012611393|nr:hypothetical protein [Rhizobium dioscoreae]GES43147.1 hypothetical protein RsS62_23990 [Rhizobium dioscoreae]